MAAIALSVAVISACARAEWQMEEVVEGEEALSDGGEEAGQDFVMPATVIEASDKMAVVPYKGENFVKSVFAAGGDMLYVCGIKEGGEFFLGYMQEEADVFQEFKAPVEEGMRAFNMAVDAKGRCHILWMSVEELELNGQSFDGITYEKSCITVVNQGGGIESEIDVTPVFSPEQRRPSCFVADEEGNYYFENGQNLVQILADGAPGLTVPCDGRIEGVGRGKSGSIYCIYSTENGTRELASLEEGRMVPRGVTLPEASASYSDLYPGVDAELLIYNRSNGIYCYEDNEAHISVSDTDMPVAEHTVAGQGALADGRICILAVENGANVFYYIPTVKQQDHARGA